MCVEMVWTRNDIWLSKINQVFKESTDSFANVPSISLSTFAYLEKKAPGFYETNLPYSFQDKKKCPGEIVT